MTSHFSQGCCIDCYQTLSPFHRKGPVPWSHTLGINYFIPFCFSFFKKKKVRYLDIDCILANTLLSEASNSCQSWCVSATHTEIILKSDLQSLYYNRWRDTTNILRGSRSRDSLGKKTAQGQMQCHAACAPKHSHPPGVRSTPDWQNRQPCATH